MEKIENEGSNLIKALGPAALIAMLVDAMLNLDKMSGNIAKQFGISYTQARGINNEINVIAYNTGNVFVDDSDEVRVQLTDTSKISRHGDKFDNDVELDFPSETAGKSSKLSSDNINFKNGENFAKFDSNGLDGSEQVIDNIRKKLDVPNHFVWESI